MTISDPVADIRALLVADPGVAALVGQHVFWGELPESEAAQMPRAAVVVSPAGGPGRPKFEKIRRTRIDTICYGASLYESWTVHLAVREALETLDRTSGSVKAIEMSSDAANARDPVKQWPTCYASYRVLSTTSV